MLCQTLRLDFASHQDPVHTTRSAPRRIRETFSTVFPAKKLTSHKNFFNISQEGKSVSPLGCALLNFQKKNIKDVFSFIILFYFQILLICRKGSRSLIATQFKDPFLQGVSQWPVLACTNTRTHICPSLPPRPFLQPPLPTLCQLMKALCTHPISGLSREIGTATFVPRGGGYRKRPKLLQDYCQPPPAPPPHTPVSAFSW